MAKQGLAQGSDPTPIARNEIEQLRAILSGEVEVITEAGDLNAMLTSVLAEEDPFSRKKNVVSAEDYIGVPFTATGFTLRPSTFFHADKPVGFSNLPVYASVEGTDSDGEAVVVNVSSARCIMQLTNAKIAGKLPAKPIVIVAGNAKQGQNPPLFFMYADATGI